MKLLSLCSLVFLVACATRTPGTDRLTRHNRTESSHVRDVPVIKQEEKHCGPTSLAMVLQYYGSKRTPKELSADLFHEKWQGTFPTDLLASARREGMLALPVSDFPSVLKEVAAGNPVIVFQDNGVSFFHRYHFSVVTGYDFKGPDVNLNAGGEKEESMDMRLFERSFILGGEWGTVILPPGKVSATGTELQHIEAAAFLEENDFPLDALTAYQGILQKWPASLLALIGAANATYALGDKLRCEQYLKSAVAADPKSALAWHNLAMIQSERGLTKVARESARKALELVEQEMKDKYQRSLADLLR